MRHLWLGRNKFIYQNKLIAPNKLNFMAMQDFDLFQLAQGREKEFLLNSHRSTIKWKAPYAPFFKINWEAACNKTQKSGIVVVMKDHIGFAMACLSSFWATLLHPLVVEFYAFWKVMELDSKLGYDIV